MLLVGWMYHFIIVLFLVTGLHADRADTDYTFWFMLAIIAALDGIMNAIFHVYGRKQ